MRFHIRPGLAVATALAFAVLVALGAWQMQRLAWKRDLIAAVETRTGLPAASFHSVDARAAAGESVDYSPVEAAGVFDHGRERRVYGLHDGEPGVFVFAPLETADGVVWVNRGFAPDAFAAPETRAAGAPQGALVVRGLYRSPEQPSGAEKMVRPTDDPVSGRYYTRDPALFDAAQAARGYIDAAAGESAAPWPRGGLTRIEFSNRHLEYALTWFGLAGALVAVFLAASVKRG
jgi:surfeit locus 1 family protein